MPNVWLDKSYDRAVGGGGLDWDTAKWKVYALAKQPLGTVQRMSSTWDWASVSTGAAQLQAEVVLNTVGANGLQINDMVIVSETKFTGTRVYVPGNVYVLGDLVIPNTVLGQPANNWIHKCVIAGNHSSAMKWAVQPGGIAASSSNIGPTFVNLGFKKGEFPLMGKHIVKAPPTGWSYSDVGNTKFRVRVPFLGPYAPATYTGWTWAQQTGYGWGGAYKVHKYLRDWAADAQIWGSTNALTNRVIRRNGVLDCNNSAINIGTNNSGNMILLLVRTAHNHTDNDLPLTEQEVVAFWDYGRYIGNHYSTQTFTGTAVLNISNFLQLSTPIAVTGVPAGEGE